MFLELKKLIKTHLQTTFFLPQNSIIFEFFGPELKLHFLRLHHWYITSLSEIIR